MEQAFLDYYRCPAGVIDFKPAYSTSSLESTFKPPSSYRNGGSREDNSATLSAQIASLAERTQVEGQRCLLAFNPTEAADLLRWERYVDRSRPSGIKAAVRQLYYAMRPAFPVGMRRHLQRLWLRGWQERPFPRWPVDFTVDQMFERLMYFSLRANPGAAIPFIWFWPEGRASCAIMTHDVETEAGLNFAPELMNMNDAFHIKSSFQVIPDARYHASAEALAGIRDRGFEVNVHDLKHDGHLYDDHAEFLKMAERINGYAERFESQGFRAGVLYRNLEWFGAYKFSYDMSVPNVAHLDPQPGGCCTVMPYFVGDILELPVTTIQDYSLLHVLGTDSLDIWREQIRQIMAQHGLISFIVHPDYLDTPESKVMYRKLLTHLDRLRTDDDLWIPLPREVNAWWRQRSRMNVVAEGDGWTIHGDGAENATLAYATLDGDQVRYTFTQK